jgi:hypothetical protein
MEIRRKIETLEHHLQGVKVVSDSCDNVQMSLAHTHERYLMEDIRDSYTQELYAWYDFEANCDY